MTKSRGLVEKYGRGMSPACLAYRKSEKFRKHQSEAGKVMTEKRRKILHESGLKMQKASLTPENVKKRNKARAWWLYSEENKMMLKARAPKNAGKNLVKGWKARNKKIAKVAKLASDLGFVCKEVGHLSNKNLDKLETYLLKVKNTRDKMMS